MKRYERLALIVDAYQNCVKSGNVEWEVRHYEIIQAIMESAPSGSGIDSGTIIDLEASHTDLLVFQADYHHMDEMGGYDGWTEHTVRVKPSFVNDIQITVSGPNRNDIKEYLSQVFHHWLTEGITQESMTYA